MVIDMTDFTHIIGTGVVVIIRAVRTMERRDARVVLCAPLGDELQVFDTSGFDQLIAQFPSPPSVVEPRPC